MRKLILAVNLTLDGFMAGPNGELDWVHMSPEIDNYLMPSLMARTDAAFIGRVLYEGFRGYWPNAASINPNLSEGEKEFAAWIDAAPKTVFSTTLAEPGWNNASIVSDGIAAAVARIKAEPGEDIVMFGGVTIAQEFIRLNLIDEYHLLISPVVIGRGRPLFPAVEDRRNLTLIQCKAFANGAVQLQYAAR